MLSVVTWAPSTRLATAPARVRRRLGQAHAAFVAANASDHHHKGRHDGESQNQDDDQQADDRVHLARPGCRAAPLP